MQKILYILRHAKTERIGPGQEDFDRKLDARGIEEARAMGKYLFKHVITPEKVLCSPAMRTRQTWDYLELPAAWTKGEPVEYTDKLYQASANEIINQIAALPEHFASAMVIGHNPGLHETCLKLAKSGNSALLGQLSSQLPTATLVTFEFSGEWQAIRQVQTTLTGVVTPHML